jgi:hypothetical protein
LAARGEVTLRDPEAWQKHLRGCAVPGKRAQRIATEGALMGGLLARGLPGDFAVLSDDAGQFNVFAHALCWIRAERGINQLLPLNDSDRRAIARVLHQLRTLYGELKSYKSAPNDARKAHIGAGFYALCATETTCAPLNQALQRLAQNRDELLLVLERPELPLHNNLSEQALRDYVKKRKISGSTRGDVVATPSPASRRPVANTASRSGRTLKIGSPGPMCYRHWPIPFVGRRRHFHSPVCRS